MNGIQRFRAVLQWFWELMADQVNWHDGFYFVPPSLWPGWDWAQQNALYCHSRRPWARFPKATPLPGYEGEDFDDDDF